MASSVMLHRGGDKYAGQPTLLWGHHCHGGSFCSHLRSSVTLQLWAKGKQKAIHTIKKLHLISAPPRHQASHFAPATMDISHNMDIGSGLEGDRGWDFTIQLEFTKEGFCHWNVSQDGGPISLQELKRDVAGVPCPFFYGLKKGVIKQLHPHSV